MKASLVLTEGILGRPQEDRMTSLYSWTQGVMVI